MLSPVLGSSRNSVKWSQKLVTLKSIFQLTLELSYTSVVPAGVATNVMTSQSMVLSGGGASVSVMTPKKLERLFFTFSVVSDEPSTWIGVQVRFMLLCTYDSNTDALSGDI